MHFGRYASFGDSSDNAFGGDFYHEQDNHTRSAVLSAIPGVFGGSYFGEIIGDQHAKSTKAMVNLSSEGSHLHFREGTLAPVLPLDPFFRLEAATVFLGDNEGSSDCIGNRLLAYFDAEATATIAKVSPIKFAFKTQIVCQGFHCEVKVRIYRQDSGHAVEFQRRDGDVFLFTNVYHSAVSHLKAIIGFHDVSFAGKMFDETPMVILPPLQLVQGEYSFGSQQNLPLACGIATRKSR